jgi:uncharacterized damage-inducible protein DinB
MERTEVSSLSDWSRAVRESSLKRLRLVPPALVNWRPTPESMSFADLAQHLIDADRWLFQKAADPQLEPMVGRSGIAGEPDPSAYSALLSLLSESGERRSEFILGLTLESLSRIIVDARFGGPVTFWWVLVRGNLDHEIHHRGQLAVYLRLTSSSPA